MVELTALSSSSDTEQSQHFKLLRFTQ